MLTGHRAIRGIVRRRRAVRDPARPATSGANVERQVPQQVEAIVQRALAQGSGGAVPECRPRSAPTSPLPRDRLTRPSGRLLRRRPGPLCRGRSSSSRLSRLAAGRRWRPDASRWARLEAVPEIERSESERPLDERRAPGAGRGAIRAGGSRTARGRAGGIPCGDRACRRAGRGPELRGHGRPVGPIGVTPLSDKIRLPFGYYRVRSPSLVSRRWRSAAMNGRAPVKLTPEDAAAPGMVFVPGGARFRPAWRHARRCPTTGSISSRSPTRRSRRSSIAGGYQDAKYWQQPFQRRRSRAAVRGSDGAVHAMRPDGPARQPGSWVAIQRARPTFRSAASAGSRLPPTRSSPARACRRCITGISAAGIDEVYSAILHVEQLRRQGTEQRPARARGLGPWGTLDMAGNVKEWCANAVGGRSAPLHSRRRVERAELPFRGNGRAESVDAQRDLRGAAGQESWPRSATPRRRSAASHAIRRRSSRSRDELFEVYQAASTITIARRSTYASRRRGRQLAGLEERESQFRGRVWQPARVRRTCSCPRTRAAVSDDRPVPVRYAMAVPNSATASTSATFEFLIRSGGRCLYPVYQGTFERGDRRSAGHGRTPRL